MKKYFVALIFITLKSVGIYVYANDVVENNNKTNKHSYKQSDLLNFKSQTDSIIVFIDFSKPSDQKRLFVLNLSSNDTLFSSVVAHGKNTGNVVATNFSNTVNSNKSSLGFYRIAEKYHGKHGLSVRLDGLEKGINDNARKRAIVMHAASYMEKSFKAKYGRYGRSLGCPAFSKKDFNTLLPYLAPETLLFIYHPNYNKLK